MWSVKFLLLSSIAIAAVVAVYVILRRKARDWRYRTRDGRTDAAWGVAIATDASGTYAPQLGLAVEPFLKGTDTMNRAAADHACAAGCMWNKATTVSRGLCDCSTNKALKV